VTSESGLARRPLLAGLALAVIGATTARAEAMHNGLYGMIGKMKAKPGQRAALIEAISAGSETMPGCLAYIVSEDAADPDAIWIAEYWDSKEAHDASLSLPSVKAAIAKGRPLIAGFDLSADLVPVSGLPLPG
jgi:quinol monooxygenase YgiN